MKALNEILIARKVEARYVTLFVLLWNPATRQMVMANAGALPPMICRGGEILKVRVEGVPLGLLDAREYEEITFEARPGDTMVLYSDGITDHLNAAGTEYGRGRLAQVVRSHCSGAVVRPDRRRFSSELDKFSTTAFDDQTVFVMKVK